uniref:Uncharacterized protein n=1 Tax=Zea mays TaxID=4577 RepID=A0A804QM58_MAIZE
MPLPRPHYRDRGGHGAPPRRHRAFQQGRHSPGMGGVAADEVRAEEGPRRAQPRASRRRIRASRENDGHHQEDYEGDRMVPLAPTYHRSTVPYVRTQAMFQLLDTGFVGLIFSCFSEDAQKVGKIQVTAFQSEGGQQHPLPLAIDPVIDLDSSCSSSDNVSASHSASVEGMEQDTGDSRVSKNNKAWRRSMDSTPIMTQIIPQIMNPEKAYSFRTILITHKKRMLIHMIQI